GQVDKEGNFTVSTPGLEAGDTITITQINGTGDKSESDPVNIRVDTLSWAISVPATINESKDGDVNNMHFKYGIGKLTIVDANGKAFEDYSKNRTFSISGIFQDVDDDDYMIMKSTIDDHYAWLYNETTDQGDAEPTGLTKQLMINSGSIKSIQNLNFSSKATGNTHSPLIRYMIFASPTTGTQHNLDSKKSYSNTISWTATETTPN
ncbi:hypothetical protein PFZ79_002504, partial [Enterococcus hirae]|nr:hypothetical protein [Enterococcus hirae]